MGIRAVDALSERDFSKLQKPRKEKRIIGQKSAFRFFDPRDGEDVRKYREILKSEKVQKWMDDVKNLSSRKMFKDVKEKGQLPKDAFLFAITGTTGVVDESEIGEVQGFVYVYPCGNEFITDGKKRYEVGFAINPDAPPHQVASALREICLEINKVRGRSSREKMEPDLPIVAFVNPRNIKPRRVLEAAGFEIAARFPYDSEPDSTPVYYYELNWEKLNKRIHEDADRIIFPNYQSVLDNVRKLKKSTKDKIILR